MLISGGSVAAKPNPDKQLENGLAYAQNVNRLQSWIL
jgi:hypothetical protein